MVRSLLAPNGTPLHTPQSIEARTQRLIPAVATLNRDLMKELAATSSTYSTPITGIGGSAPSGLGFTFGDSWARTQRGVMEFSMPQGQVDVMNMALRFAAENAFVAKALRLKTWFTCKGVKNQGPDDMTNGFFDSVMKKLYLESIYRDAVWLYYSVGLVPILLPEKGKPLNFIEILDPRMVRTERYFGKSSMYLRADQKMINAMGDPQGRTDPRNKDRWDALPASWKKQLLDRQKNPAHATGEVLIKLDEGSYICLENRYAPFDQRPTGYDGTPLQSLFAHLTQYRQLMAADFATGFLAKNLIALVSVGDPKAEGTDYVRPDDTVLYGLQNTFQNPNQAQWVFGDPTLNVRYITPDTDALKNEKYAESKEAIKNLLPGPFWYNDSGGSYADAQAEMIPLQDEVDATNEDFDRGFWTPIYERAAEGRAKIANKHIRAPKHDRSSLKDEGANLQRKSELFNNGGLDIKSLMEEHGLDPDVITARLQAQQKDAKAGIYMPSFEQKQGIVANKTYGIKPAAAAPPGSGSGKKPNGRPKSKASGARKQSETKTNRTPRPSKAK